MQTVAQQISDEGSPIVSGSSTIIYPRNMVLYRPIFHLNVQWFCSVYFPTLLKIFDLLGVMGRVLEHIPAAFGPQCAYIIWEIPDWYWHNKVCFYFSLIAHHWSSFLSTHWPPCQHSVSYIYPISYQSCQYRTSFERFWKALCPEYVFSHCLINDYYFNRRPTAAPSRLVKVTSEEPLCRAQKIHDPIKSTQVVTPQHLPKINIYDTIIT